MNSSPTKVCSRYATRALVWSLHGYRWILSPIKNAVLGPAGCCRFTPTCSAFAIDALQSHGLTKGLALTLGRLARCHPWGGCGNDPVPAPKQAISSAPHASSAHEFPNALTH